MPRAVFDEEEIEKKDSEITLGMASLLGIFFGLVLVCGVFFGFGYSIGRGSSPGSTAAAAQTATNPPDSSAPSASAPSALPKPSALQNLSDDAQPAAQASGDSTADADKQPEKPRLVEHAEPATIETTQPQRAVAATAKRVETTAAVAESGEFMVQVAAVSHAEDAAVLVAALEKRGYHVTTRTGSGDNLTHVQVGPFSTRDAARQMRTRLLADGYNAILKP